MVSVPGDEAVSPSQGGRVQLKDGGDVVALRHGHQGIGHLLRGPPAPPRRVLLGVQLRREPPERQDRPCRATPTAPNTLRVQTGLWTSELGCRTPGTLTAAALANHSLLPLV